MIGRAPHCGRGRLGDRLESAVLINFGHFFAPKVSMATSLMAEFGSGTPQAPNESAGVGFGVTDAFSSLMEAPELIFGIFAAIMLLGTCASRAASEPKNVADIEAGSMLGSSSLLPKGVARSDADQWAGPKYQLLLNAADHGIAGGDGAGGAAGAMKNGKGSHAPRASRARADANDPRGESRSAASAAQAGREAAGAQEGAAAARARRRGGDALRRGCRGGDRGQAAGCARAAGRPR